MKKIFILFIMLFLAHMLFSQVLYKEGIVKGKHVTYEVRRGEGPLNILTYIWNMKTPDTTFCKVPVPHMINALFIDMNMQIAEIIHDYLSPEEKSRIVYQSMIGMTFRLNAQIRKPLQITNFFYFHEDSLWMNFSPDRLYELEQLILKKLELPVKLQEIYFEADFMASVSGGDIKNIKETRKRRKAAIKAWQQNDIEVKVFPRPKYILEDEANDEHKEQKKEQGETYLRCIK